MSLKLQDFQLVLQWLLPPKLVLEWFLCRKSFPSKGYYNTYARSQWLTASLYPPFGFASGHVCFYARRFSKTHPKKGCTTERETDPAAPSRNARSFQVPVWPLAVCFHLTESACWISSGWQRVSKYILSNFLLYNSCRSPQSPAFRESDGILRWQHPAKIAMTQP